ncbi:MAG: hypothetical protein AAF493_14840 [Pseudomonadota bacterium]
MTDGKFENLLLHASRHHTYHHTEPQIFYQYCRRVLKPTKWPIRIGIALVAALLVTLFFNQLASRLPFAAGFIGFGALIAWGTVWSRGRARHHARRDFAGMLSKWRAKRGQDSMPFLLSQTRLETPPPTWPEGDIYDYGVERVLFVERDILVDMFVLNGFHAEQRAVVLSATGYPSYVGDRVQTLIANKPELEVYVLHDATAAGHRAVQIVASGWPGARLKDLGLSPDDVKKLHRFRVINPKRQDYAVPIDSLPYPILASGIAGAIASGQTLAESLAQRQQDAEGDFG